MAQLQLNYIFIRFYQLQLQTMTVMSITITKLQLLSVACKNRYRIRKTIFALLPASTGTFIARN